MACRSSEQASEVRRQVELVALLGDAGPAGVTAIALEPLDFDVEIDVYQSGDGLSDGDLISRANKDFCQATWDVDLQAFVSRLGALRAEVEPLRRGRAHVLNVRGAVVVRRESGTGVACVCVNASDEAVELSGTALPASRFVDRLGRGEPEEGAFTLPARGWALLTPA